MDGATNEAEELDLGRLNKKQNFSQLMSQGQDESMINDFMRERSTDLPNSSMLDAQGLPLSMEAASMINDELISMGMANQVLDPMAGNRSLFQLDRSLKNSALEKIEKRVE